MIKKYKKKNIGQFVPRFPKKYIGSYPIIVRSSWERMMCQWLDSNESVIKWSSEGHIINYYDPIQMKRRRYFPDFFVTILNKDKKPINYIIEVKPEKETKPPTKTKGQSKKTQLYQETTWITNQAKFKAANNYCKKLGYKFMLLTEKEMFGKNNG
jgi:hypothetical protein